jgi:mycofactocin precursor
MPAWVVASGRPTRRVPLLTRRFFHFCHQCSYCAAMNTDVIETPAPATVADGQADGQVGDLTAPAPEEVLTSEDLIEEISIDGMCGVY